MNHGASFTISEFTNPSGEVVFRVSGWLDGQRIRKNFPTRAEAKAETDVLEIQRLQGETGLRPTFTRLLEDQLHEAEAVFKRLSGKSHSMSFCVDFALANYREPAARKNLKEAVAAYVAVKQHEFEQDLISEPYVVRLHREMHRFLQRQKHFPANDNYTSLRNRAGKGMEGGGVQGRRRSLLPARLRRSPRIGVERGVGHTTGTPPQRVIS